MDTQYLIDIIDGRIESLLNEVERARAIRAELADGADVAIHVAKSKPKPAAKKNGTGKKRGRRKKAPEPDGLAGRLASAGEMEPAVDETNAPEPGTELMTKAEYARYRGVHGSQVSNWIAQKRLPVEDGGKIDPEKADAALDEAGLGVKRKKKDPPIPGGVDPSVVERYRTENPNDPDLAWLEEE